MDPAINPNPWAEGSGQPWRLLFPAELVQLLQIHCIHGCDLRRVTGTHHVIVNPSFSINHTSPGSLWSPRVFEDWKRGRGVINCSNCGEGWGLWMSYQSVSLSALDTLSMLLETPQGRTRPKEWSCALFLVHDFDFLQHCARSLPDLSVHHLAAAVPIWGCRGQKSPQKRSSYPGRVWFQAGSPS